MRRRAVVLGAAAAFGGCSARERGDPGPTDANPTPTTVRETEPPTSTPGSSPEPTGTAEPAEMGTAQVTVESAREHLAMAFDELREMRPVGAENVRASTDRFRASDHQRVDEEVSAATSALDRVGSSNASTEVVEGLRAALELARNGVELYAAFRRAFRAEWRFERHAFGAEWADASEQASHSEEAIVTWEDRGRAVTEAAIAVHDAGGAQVPRLVLDEWYRDGAVLSNVAGPWTDVVGGFASFADAVRLADAGIDAMDADEYRLARERLGPAADEVGEAHRRLAQAKADDAQAFQAYALPIRRRCGPLREAYTAQVEAAAAATRGESDRADELWTRAMDRIVTAEMENPLPEP